MSKSGAICSTISWPVKVNAEGTAQWIILAVYNPADPWLIALHISGEELKPQTWTVSRDVVHDGMINESGRGSFSCGPEDSENVRFTFHPGSPLAQTVLVNRRHLAWFLHCSAELVPYEAEAEYFDVDKLCDQLLGRAVS